MAIAKTFDGATKLLVASHPQAWLECRLGHGLPEVVVVNADLATITTEVDKILHVEADQPWIIHVEFETNYKPETPLRVQRYNILARYRHGLPVQSIIVLMRPAADGPKVTGFLEDHLPDGTRYHEFRYNVVRVWELPAAEILERNILLVASCACLSCGRFGASGSESQDGRANRPRAGTIRGSRTLIRHLFADGTLVHKDTFVEALIRGVRHMQESSTYQAILREGREQGIEQGIERGIQRGKSEEARKLLLKTGQNRFGLPDPRIVATIESISEVSRIEDLILRIFDVSNWDELFAD